MCTIHCDVPLDHDDQLLPVSFHDWTAEAPDFQRRDLSWAGDADVSPLQADFYEKLKIYGVAPQKTGVVTLITLPDDNLIDTDNEPQLRPGVESVSTEGQKISKYCNNTGVEAQALSYVLDQPVNSTRECAKDFKNWFDRRDVRLAATPPPRALLGALSPCAVADA